MKKIKTVAAAHALLGLTAGVPAVASAQHLTSPPRVERHIPDVADLPTSKVAHLGRLTTQRQTLATAIAKSSALAGTITVGSVAGAVERSALTSKSANAITANATTARTKETSFPERTSKIAAHGSLTEVVPALARAQPAAKASTENSISHEPFSIKSITN